MLYSVHIYGNESLLDVMEPAEADHCLDRHHTFQHPRGETVLDGPFAETNEQLLGFYLSPVIPLPG